MYIMLYIYTHINGYICTHIFGMSIICYIQLSVNGESIGNWLTQSLNPGGMDMHIQSRVSFQG